LSVAPRKGAAARHDHGLGARCDKYLIRCRTCCAVPTASEQNKIVSKLAHIHAKTQRLARLYERKLAALDALKKSLLHQAFTGNL
jgi:hypothetical protein